MIRHVALLSKGSPAAAEATKAVVPAVLHSEIAGPEILMAYNTENKALVSSKVIRKQQSNGTNFISRSVHRLKPSFVLYLSY